MRVLLIIDKLGTGGKERRIVELLKGLREHDEIICELVLLKDLILYREVLHLGYKIHIFNRKIKKDPLVFFRILSLCKKFKPDIIHSWGSMPSIYVFLIARFTGARFINAMITNAKRKIFSQEFFRSIITFPFSDVIVSNSFAGLNAYKANPKKGVVIYNGFNFSRTAHLESPENMRNELNIKTPHTVLMVGAFHPRKDYKTFLESARMILAKRNDITFIAVGEGPLLPKYQSDYGYLAGKVIFTGRRDDVESIIQMADVCVLATDSNVHHEGISNSILEYMALRKPVIATTGGGTNEILIDGTTGMLIENKNSRQLSDAIERFIDNPEISRVIGQKALDLVREQFSIEKMINSTIDLYKKLLKN